VPWVLVLGGAEGLAALTIGFEIVAAAVVLLILATAAKTWLEPLLASTATRRGGGILRILDLPGAAIRRIASSAFSAVTHSISVAATHRMAPLARWFHAMGSLVLGSAWALGHFAGDMAYSIERLATVVLPREIGRATRPISRRAARALAGAIAAGLAVKNLRRYLDRLYGHTIRPALRHLTHAVDVTIPRTLGGIRTGLRRVEREIAHPSTRWLRRTAVAMWGAALLGLMVRTLARRFPWLFCRKVKNVGNRLCGLDGDLLSALLMDTVLITGTVSVVAFARELQAIEGTAVDLLAGFIDEM
jgi:hypothetical protein